MIERLRRWWRPVVYVDVHSNVPLCKYHQLDHDAEPWECAACGAYPIGPDGKFLADFPDEFYVKHPEVMRGPKRR